MKISEKEIEHRLDRFTKTCRKAGVKVTQQRIEVFREVAATGDHPDAERVYQGVRRRMPTISLDTVYRTLWWLKDLGLVTALSPIRERTRFDANLDHHHHFICIRCGLTRDFLNKDLDDLDLEGSVQAIGYVETAHVEIKGICLECAEKEGA
jgi:Fur family peroxide stress response transcriptional regulator